VCIKVSFPLKQNLSYHVNINAKTKSYFEVFIKNQTALEFHKYPPQYFTVIEKMQNTCSNFMINVCYAALVFLLKPLLIKALEGHKRD
jgi:hypothetical protein